jgi:hypothetical protein
MQLKLNPRLEAAVAECVIRALTKSFLFLTFFSIYTLASSKIPHLEIFPSIALILLNLVKK